MTAPFDQNAELRRVRAGMTTEIVEASDHLARVLGYPLDPDENGVPTGPHYCVGEHTISTLAAEAARVIAALKAERAWRPIETAPLDGTPLLLFCPGINSWNRPRGAPDIVVGVWANEDYSFGWYSDIGDVDQGYESTGAYFVHERLRPTHWQPLPALPTEETDPNGR